jgi:hypothetical protein
MEKTKRISDMYFAATLLAYGVEIQKIDADNPRKQEFLFVDKPMSVYKKTDLGITQMEVVDIDQVHMMFTSKTLFVSASGLADALRNIKSLIHANKC